MQRVGAGRRGPERDLPAFFKNKSAGKEIFDREPVDHAEVRHRGFHRTQHFQAEAGAVLERAAILVSAAVFERRMKLRNQITVRGVDFDAIEARGLRALCGGGVCGDALRDPGFAHLLRNDDLERRLINRMRYS